MKESKLYEDYTKKEQIELMRDWFTDNYQDPVESCPYDSAEGGYIFIWGGPYEPNECLQDQFEGDIQKDIIDELSSELEDISSEWSGYPIENPCNYEYPDFFKEELGNEINILNNLTNSLNDLKQILTNEISLKNKTFLKMIYVHSITILETFLSDFFIKNMFTSKQYIINFVENNTDYKNINFQLNDIFKRYNKIEESCMKYLTNIVWHNLAKVSNLYSCTFKIEFPQNIGELYRAINNRHHCVHRNGKRQDGTDLDLKKEDILSLIDKIFELANFINDKFSIISRNELE